MGGPPATQSLAGERELAKVFRAHQGCQKEDHVGIEQGGLDCGDLQPLPSQSHLENLWLRIPLLPLRGKKGGRVYVSSFGPKLFQAQSQRAEHVEGPREEVDAQKEHQRHREA